jgi:hypothetical protein
MRSNRWLAPVVLLSFFTLQGHIQAAEEIIELQLQYSNFKSRREHRGSTRCGPLFRLATFGELSCCVSDCTWRKSPALTRSRPVRNVAIKTV